MDWEDAVEEAKQELGYYGYIDGNKWEEVVDLARFNLDCEREYENDNWWDNYSDFLKSDKWVEVRKKVLTRDLYICKKCKKNGNHAHHLNYKNLCDINNIITLCEDCHEFVHGRKFNLKNIDETEIKNEIKKERQTTFREMSIL